MEALVDVPQIDPQAAWQKLQSETGSIYLDVRTEDEYDEGHPDGAWNIPILFRGPRGMELNPHFSEAAAAALPRDVAILVGCRSGPRSQKACLLLHELGFNLAINVQGGFHGATDAFGRLVAPGWMACGLPTSTEPTPGRTWADIHAP
jgi:rhodanese-related sulfurtransferase